MKNINIKHHSKEVHTYYLSAKDNADKKYRSIAIKVHEILDLPFEDLFGEYLGNLNELKKGRGSMPM
ncbi:hypothetical protein C518_3017 [Lysinibacillus fusiformis ZB2]|nr:hypothetical protein C518_3017 [Lysinibacillus fusiformis ZB2]